MMMMADSPMDPMDLKELGPPPRTWGKQPRKAVPQVLRLDR